MNIYQRLNEVRKVVDFVKKDKDVSGRYMAVTHDAVTTLVRDALIENGIMVVPHCRSSKISMTGTTTGKGIPIIRYEAMYCVEFVNCDEPSDRVSVELESHALDEGDKAPGKATSYATKYAMLKLFSIPSGDEDEERKDQKASKITPTAGVMESLPTDVQIELRDLADEVSSRLKKGKDAEAYEHLHGKDWETDQRVAIWSLFDSKERKRLDDAGRAKRGKQSAITK